MKVEELERELRAERPEPSLDFARRLDEWAEAGFPREDGLGPRLASRAGPLRRAWDRLTSVPPRRILMPAGAVATVVVVAGVAIGRQENTDTGLSPSAAPPAQTTGAPPTTSDQTAAPQAQGSAGAAETAPQIPAPPAGAGGEGFVGGAGGRIVEASAQLTLGAPTDEVQHVADQVVAVTDRYRGVVLDSQVSSDRAGARASFQLQIPSARLDAALADLSGLGDVISRTQAGHDITARAVHARRDLAGTLVRTRRTRIALVRADTREQRLVLRSQLESLEATARAQRAELGSVKRRGRFATVAVDVTSNAPATAADDGNWGLDNAVDDARDVLETIGGIALVSLAILLPLSLVAALIAFAISRGRRRSRERALGE